MGVRGSKRWAGAGRGVYVKIWGLALDKLTVEGGGVGWSLG